MPSNRLVVYSVALALAFSALFVVPGWFTHPASPENPIPASTAKFHFDPNVEIWYKNEKPAFSFRVPQGFTTPNTSIVDGKGQEVVVINEDQDALLMLMYPISSGADTELTEGIVRQNSPEERVSDFRQVSLTEGVRGLYFKTDAKVWDGDGVAFWFIHDGYLYEISTYRKDAELLELVTKTLRFGVPVPPVSK